MAEINVTKSTFRSEVLESAVPVLVDFWASWCGPCKMLAPVVKEVAERHPEIKVAKINVDEEAELAIEYGIMSIPTLMVFKGGEVANKSVGYMGKAEVEALL